MQTYVWTATGMRESDAAPTLFVKAHEISNSMKASLEEKLAMVLWYVSESDARRMSIDMAALRSYLDDREITEWLDARNKNGMIKNTRFTTARHPPEARPYKR